MAGNGAAIGVDLAMTRLHWWAPETAFIITLLIGKIRAL